MTTLESTHHGALREPDHAPQKALNYDMCWCGTLNDFRLQPRLEATTTIGRFQHNIPSVAFAPRGCAVHRVLTEEWRGSALPHTCTQCAASVHHTKRGDPRAHRFHTNHTHKQTHYLSVHPTHLIQADGGRRILLAVATASRHRRPAVSARLCMR